MKQERQLFDLRETHSLWSSVRRALASFSAYAALGVGIPIAAPCAELPRLEVLRAAYVESATSIRTIRCEMEIGWERLKPLSSTMVPAGIDPTVLTKVKLIQDGVRVARESEAQSESGQAAVRSWAGFDGSLFASWRHSIKAREGHEQLPQGRIDANLPDDLRDISMANLLGTSVFPDESLQRLLDREGVRVVGFEEVNGNKCVKVDLAPYAAYQKHPDLRLQIIAWFDPAHGYLPRRLRFVNPLVVKASDQQIKGEITIQDFQKMPIDSTRFVWLPVAAVQINSGLTQYRVRVSNVVVNETVPDDVFRPVFPFGTYVLEQRAGQPDKRYFAGGDAGAKHYEELQKESIKKQQQAKTAAPSTNVVSNDSARNNQVSWLTRSLRWAGAICMAIAVGIVLKKLF